MEKDKLLKVSEVASRLQVHPAMVGQYLRNGILPGVRIGNGRGQWRVSETDLANYLRKG